MINRYPLWKNLLILLVIILAVIYALPNIYAPDPALQISHDSGVVEQAAIDAATAALAADGIAFVGAEKDGNNALIRLEFQDDQSRAQQIVNRALPNEYIVALNQAPTTPGWLRSIGAGPMTYGLDLSGGVHFLLEVDMDAAINRRLNDSMATVRALLRDERVRYRPPMLVDEDNRLVVRFAEESARNEANRLIREEFPEMQYRTERSGGDYVLYMSFTEASILELQGYALQQNLTTLRSRVNELGVKEPRVQPMGTNRIIIELPGIQDTARAKELISAAASLQIHMQSQLDAAPGTTETYEYRGDRGAQMVEVSNEVIVSGENVTNAQSSYDENGMPQVNITLDAVGARRMNEATRFNVNRMMGILLIETKTNTITEEGPDGELISYSSAPYEETRMISWAQIRSPLGRQFRITGLSNREANDLALLIRSGALAAPMYFQRERTIGPSLGQENIDRGMLSVQIGMAAVVLFMLAYYRVCGLVANIALTINLVLMVAVMSIIGATLTLPGIAGIVLTIGMAVDANVLIYSRIREELRRGLSVPKAIDAGFGRAYVTIVDANITTLLVAVILYAIGTGPVRGFAVTLSIGILSSMFTAVVVSRAIVNLMYGGRDTRKISIGIRLPKPARKTAPAQ